MSLWIRMAGRLIDVDKAYEIEFLEPHEDANQSDDALLRLHYPDAAAGMAGAVDLHGEDAVLAWKVIVSAFEHRGEMSNLDQYRKK